jgi:non-specific serine/threonine protein kinase
MSRTLVGRDDELRQLTELVARQPLVTVTGPPGVGKSALARALADRVTSDDRLPALWCDVADLGDAHATRDVGAALADRLGFGSVESLLAALGEMRHLLVVDGCEIGPPAACDVVDELLDACPDLRVVATSRRPLGSPHEYLWVVPPLPTPAPAVTDADALVGNPAVRLYLERSASAGSEQPATPDHLAVVADLVRELDGLPLGIELAAARARSLGPGDLLRRIDQQLDLLRTTRTGRGSLRAALDIAYDQLDEDEQALFRAMSVFGGSTAGDLVNAVCAPDGADDLTTADHLAGLVESSLVQAEPGAGGAVRYRLLNVVRRYAADRLAAAGETDAAEERSVERLGELADSFVAAATESWSDELVARMLGCFHTLVGAIELAIRRDPDASRAARLVLPLYSAVHGLHAAEVAAVGDAVLQTWPDGDEPRRPEAAAVIAAAHLFAGDASGAGELARAVLDAPEASDLAQVLASRTAGFAGHYDGDHTAAVVHLDRGIELARSWGGPFERELSVARLAVRAAGPSVDDALVGALVDLAALSAGAGEPVNQMWCLVVLTHVLVRSGRADEAAAVTDEALDLATRLDHAWGRGSSLRALAVVEAVRTGWDAGRSLWEAALDVNVQSGDRGAVAQTIEHAVCAAAAAGEPDLALTLGGARLQGATPTILPPMLPEPDGLPSAAGTPSVAEAARRFRDALAAPPDVAGPSDPSDRAGPVAAPAATDGPALVRRGDVCTVTFAGETATVRHAKGLDDLARLLAAPGSEVHCLDLMDAAVVEPDTGANVDRTARARYEQRIRDLQAELDEAAAHNDTGREEIVSAELDALVDHLARETALAGRDRSANATVERARAAVRWRLRAAIERISEAHGRLGHHLDTSVRTGAWCSYEPAEPTEWRIET